MKHYRFHYQSILRFSTPVTAHYFKLRCLPCNNECQRVLHEELQLMPAVSLRQDVDAFGNRIQYGHTLEERDCFIFTSSGVVEQEAGGLPASVPSPMFRLESCLTAPSAEMKEFARRLLPDAACGEVRPAALFLADAVYRRLAYVPGSTGNETRAAEVFACRRGVCQDYVHLFLSLCRLKGIPARYVNGFMPGTGVTHAWAEVYGNGAWWGIDPTNNLAVEPGYIKIAHGRDASDCPVNRGIFIGGGAQRSEVRVITEEIG